MSVLPGRGAG
jgi:glycerate 2-kinase